MKKNILTGTVVVMCLVAILTVSLIIKQDKVTKLDNLTKTQTTVQESRSYFASRLDFSLPVAWQEFEVSIIDSANPWEYNNSDFSGLKPDYSQIIPYTLRYKSELPYCPEGDTMCLAEASISLIEYGDSQPYLMGCRGDCEVFDLRSEEDYLQGKIPTFKSGEISWFCDYNSNGGGFTLTFSCQSYYAGKSLKAELSYSPGLEYLGREGGAIDGDLTFEEFSDLTKKQDQHKQAISDFIEFVKTVNIKE